MTRTTIFARLIIVTSAVAALGTAAVQAAPESRTPVAADESIATVAVTAKRPTLADKMRMSWQDLRANAKNMAGNRHQATRNNGNLG